MTSREKVTGATTVIKALSILKLAGMGTKIRASVVAKALNVDKSTGSRLIRTLAGEGFLIATQDGGKEYILGPAVLELAASLQREVDIQQVSLDVLSELRDHTGETVHIQRRMGDLRVCIAQLSSNHSIRWVLDIGETRPLTAGSSAKVLLAALPDEDVDRIVQGARAKQFTEYTLDAVSLLAEVRDVRKNGYAMNEGERIDGVGGVSLPIKNASGNTVAALAVSGPAARWTTAKMLENLDVLRDGAARISARIGDR